MKIIVFGASGKTGRLVVEEAVRAGHEVTAFVHGDEETPRPGVRVVTGDATDPSAVRAALAGGDAVIDTVGGDIPWKDRDLETSVAAAIVTGMKAEGLRRLVAISALGVGDSAPQAPFLYAHLLMPTMMRGVVKDKTRMEDKVDASGLDFVIVRPAALTDAPRTGTLRVLSAGETGHHASRADLARFLVDQLVSDAFLGRAVAVAND